MASFIEYVHALAVAVLVGKVVLLSWYPRFSRRTGTEPFGKVVRQLFPAYYGLGMGTPSRGCLMLSLLYGVGVEAEDKPISQAPYGHGDEVNLPSGIIGLSLQI
jgi:hypothetical protein